MTQFLPPNLLVLFQARPPIQYIAPIEKPKLPQYSGIAQFTKGFEDPATVDYTQFKPLETKEQRNERKRKERHDAEEDKINKAVLAWDPRQNPKATSDGYKTLFVSRVNFNTSESKLKREFEEFGPIKKIRLVHDTKSGKPRGYAFIEYEKERDMRTAYKQADGKKVDDRRVLVDVERGRTVMGWKPRRFGGGLGSTRAGGADVNQKWSGREPPAEDRREDRDRDRERERAPADHRDRDRDRDRDAKKEKERGDKDRERERDRDRGHDRDRDRDREHRRDRDEHERDGDKSGKDRERERDRDRDRDRSDRRR